MASEPAAPLHHANQIVPSCSRNRELMTINQSSVRNSESDLPCYENNP
jgi:hypothetical protein